MAGSQGSRPLGRRVRRICVCCPHNLLRRPEEDDQYKAAAVRTAEHCRISTAISSRPLPTASIEITMVDHRKEDFVKFEANMRNVDELMECHLVSGGYDYLLRFVCRNINHYQARMENLLERNIGIEKYFSYIVLKSPTMRNALPLKALLDSPQ
jgi:DNA-binding Lrp family transcriptional regulator